MLARRDGKPVSRYVALLRGINVGGKNVIKMADLKACFEAQGFDGGGLTGRGHAARAALVRKGGGNAASERAVGLDTLIGTT